MVVAQTSAETLAELLATRLRQRQLSPRRLAELTSIPEDTIKGWLLGRGRSIREWERAIVVVAVLDLAYAQTIELLNAARVAPASLERLASVELSAPYRELQTLVVDWEQRHNIIQQLRASALQSVASPATSPEPTGAEASIPQPIAPLPTAAKLPRRWLGWLSLGLAVVLIGSGLWWLLRPQVLVPLAAGDWGSYTDIDIGGTSEVTDIQFNCVPTAPSTSKQLLDGCGGIHGNVQGQHGYAGIYRTLSDIPDQTIDLSQYQELSFLIRGSGQHVHVGIEVQTAPGQPIQEHIANFELTPNWKHERIPFSAFVPLNPGSKLDLTKIRAISWSIIQGDQTNVEIMVDQVQLEP